MSISRLKKLERLLNAEGFRAVVATEAEDGSMIHWESREPVTADQLQNADLHVTVLWG